MTQLKAQVVVIGDEILSGNIQDRNIQPLTTWLDQMGFVCDQVTITRDHPDLLLATIQKAWDSADLIITTGGIGPTKDDMTKQALADLSQSKLVDKESARKLVIELYARRGREWNAELNGYHMIPEKVEVFDNPQGFAPGLCYKKDGKILFSTPGVPRELRAMMSDVLPALIKEHFPTLKDENKVITFRTFGMPEERIFKEVCPGLWEWLEQFGKVSSLPQIYGVDIHVKVNDINAYDETKKKISDYLHATDLSEHIWSDEFIPLEEVIVKEATAKGLTLGFAESCTGGLVAHRLTNIAGSSSVFMGSMVTYSNEAKMAVLGVKEDTLGAHGAVSEETATEMAYGAREKLNVDIALSLTGIAGPGGGTEEKPVGTVCIGFATKEENSAKRYNYIGDRALLKQRFAQAALFKAWKFIKNY